MQILARYLATAFIKNLILSLFGLTILFFFQTIITQLNDYTFSQLLIYVSYDFPKMMVMVAPPASLVAMVMTLSGLSKTHELIAIHSIGISTAQILTILLPIVFVLCCFSLIAQDRILPMLYEQKTVFYWKEMKHSQDFFLDFRKDKIWYRSNNMIYHLKTFDFKNEIIKGIGVYVFDSQFNLTELLQGESAHHNGHEWVLETGKATKFTGSSGFPKTENFKSRTLNIKEQPSDFKMIEKEVDRLRIKDLNKFIETNKRSGIDSKGYETKLHSRFALSFIPLIMALLAVPFSVSGTREGRTSTDLGIAFAITFFYWISFSMSLSLGLKGTISPIAAAWGPSILFALLAVYLLKAKKVF